MNTISVQPSCKPQGAEFLPSHCSQSPGSLLTSTVQFPGQEIHFFLQFIIDGHNLRHSAAGGLHALLKLGLHLLAGTASQSSKERESWLLPFP